MNPIYLQHKVKESYKAHPYRRNSSNNRLFTYYWVAVVLLLICLVCNLRGSHRAMRDFATSSRILHDSKETSVLVIAAVPLNARHILSLWSQLECFTLGFNRVIVAAPDWSRIIVEPIVLKAISTIPHLASNAVHVQTKFFINDRYDIGLWCDTFKFTNNLSTAADYYALVNDSIFALRPFTDIVDVLKQSAAYDARGKKLKLSSLNYSTSSDDYKYWVESVFRGFTKEGLAPFLKHSSVPADHPFYCRDDPNLDGNGLKRCIVENFEVKIASLYEKNEVRGLYPADFATYKGYATENKLEKKSWVDNHPFWQGVLRKELHFPAVKVNSKMIGNPMDSAGQCFRYVDLLFLFKELNQNIEKKSKKEALMVDEKPEAES